MPTVPHPMEPRAVLSPLPPGRSCRWGSQEDPFPTVGVHKLNCPQLLPLQTGRLKEMAVQDPVSPLLRNSF